MNVNKFIVEYEQFPLIVCKKQVRCKGKPNQQRLNQAEAAIKLHLVFEENVEFKDIFKVYLKLRRANAVPNYLKKYAGFVSLDPVEVFQQEGCLRNKVAVYANLNNLIESDCVHNIYDLSKNDPKHNEFNLLIEVALHDGTISNFTTRSFTVVGQEAGDKRKTSPDSPDSSMSSKTKTKRIPALVKMKGKIAIIGSGLVGKSWAVIFSKAGYNVCLYDTQKKQLDAALESINVQLNEFEKQGLLMGCIKTSVDAFKLVTTSEDLSKAISGAIFVQECVPENLDLKKKVFGELDSIALEDVILSSSSSCLYPSLFTKELKHKGRCIVSHPVNPPSLVPLVEIVPSPDTCQSVIDMTIKIMKDVGQAPVLLKKEVNGFLLNRLQYAVLMEAWRLVEDGVCSPEDIDTTMTQGLGLRYSLQGPFETIHLNAPGGVKDYCERYATSIEKVCAEQSEVRNWSGPTVDVIHDAMCKTIPVESLGERMAVRDKRLASLRVHMGGTDSEINSSL